MLECTVECLPGCGLWAWGAGVVVVVVVAVVGAAAAVVLLLNMQKHVEPN